MQDTIVSTADAHAIRIGCSGWNYKHWRDAFYPKDLPVRRWFEFYAQHFDTVEINNSFYRLPSPETFAKWRDQAPPGFCYTGEGQSLHYAGKEAPRSRGTAGPNDDVSPAP